MSIIVTLPQFRASSSARTYGVVTFTTNLENDMKEHLIFHHLLVLTDNCSRGVNSPRCRVQHMRNVRIVDGYRDRFSAILKAIARIKKWPDDDNMPLTAEMVVNGKIPQMKEVHEVLITDLSHPDLLVPVAELLAYTAEQTLGYRPPFYPHLAAEAFRGAGGSDHSGTAHKE